MARILFECLDKDVPAGGVRRLYRHVEVLQASGFDAYMLHHTAGFRMSWFESSAPVLYWDHSFMFREADVLVIPEGHANIMAMTLNASYRRVVISLNWANIYAALPCGVDWRAFNIETVIAGGEYERTFIRATMGIESFVIRQGLDTNVFCPAPEKREAIAYMSLKLPKYSHLIESIFRSMAPEFNSVPFIPIEGMNHTEVAGLLGKTAVFLGQSFPEGVSRKMLEAMSSGCIVVGFPGHGSLEFMRHLENCYLAPDGDALLAAQYLITTINALRSNTAGRMQRAARATALTYSAKQEEESVLSFWTTYLAACK